MEEKLVEHFNDLLTNPNVTGCVLTDNHGLCILSSPNVTSETSGVVSAIAQHAALLQDSSSDDQPLILLENETRQCCIHTDGGVTTTLFKTKVNPA